MSRPIAYNASGPLSGSIRGGSVNYTVDSGNRDYTTFASKKWVPSADGVAPIIFVTDSYTQGITNQATAVPLFYSCNGTGSAAIIYTANRVPGSPGNYSDANVALNDLITARGYFILESNDPFEGIDADSLVLDVDAAKMSSYPQTGTNWRDLSGVGNNGTLTNGPTWNLNGWFVFDGVDDYVNNPLVKLQACTFIGTAATTTLSSNPMLFNAGPHGSGPDLFFYNNLISWNTWDGDGNALTSIPTSVTNGAFHHYVLVNDPIANNARLYYDSNLIGTAGYRTAANNTNLTIGGSSQDYMWNGKISSFDVYNKTLSASDIKQNYFGSPIVTDGLVFVVDANNIVSYPKSGTAWYNLTGSNIGTFINGPTFNQENGGSIKFDGTDDYVNVPTATNLNLTSQGTVSVWINPATVTQGLFAGLVAKNAGGSVNQQSYQLSWRQVSGGLYGAICDGSGTYNEVLASFPSIANAWYNIVFTWNGSLVSMYTNGVLSAQTTQTINNQVLNTDLTIGGYTYKGAGGSGEPFNGKIANTKLYNRGLTASEVLQNYQAEQYRFETPAGPITNGLLLYWDAGNLDSYPGTGTTIYDLSGNGNNGTLYNGVGYNQTNGGVLVFDGVDDYVQSGGPNLYTSDYTVMGASRYIAGGARGRMINSTNYNWLLGQWNNSTENYYANGWVSSVQFGANDNNWRIYAGNWDRTADLATSYVNNILSSGPNNNADGGPYGITIGKIGYAASEYSKGEFSFTLVYNRVLTAAEMTQNYNYFKGRFGL
jgi:hypothetical protein